MKTTAIVIKGTHCNACKMLIEDVSCEITGINSCKVDFATGKTEVEHEDSVDWNKFKKEVESIGDYKVDIPNI